MPNAPRHRRHLDVGGKRDPMLAWWMMLSLFLVLLFTIPFYREPFTHDHWIGNMASWPFTSLLLSGVLTLIAAYMFLGLWRDYEPLPLPDLPSHAKGADGELSSASLDADLSAEKAAAAAEMQAKKAAEAEAPAEAAVAAN